MWMSPLRRALERPSALWIMALTLSTISAYRLLGPGRDYNSYLAMFQWARDLTSISQIQTFITKDLGFGLFLYILTKLYAWPNSAMFFIIALLGVSIKLWCYRRFSPNFAVATLAYLSLFFVVHDYTQLRASSALAVITLAACLILASKKRISGALLSVGAIGLHNSVLLVLPFILVATASFAMMGVLAGISLFSGVFIKFLPELTPRAAEYILHAQTFPTPNPISTLKIYQYISLLLFFYYRQEIQQKSWIMVEVTGWLLLAGLGFFFGLFSIPGFAHRISELFTVFMPFLIAGLATLMPKKMAILYVSMGVVIGCWSSYRILN